MGSDWIIEVMRGRLLEEMAEWRANLLGDSIFWGGVGEGG